MNSVFSSYNLYAFNLKNYTFFTFIMNLFSQSKLKLKLKNPNNASADSENKSLKPEISESLKSENVSTDNAVSENDSFVEILRTTQSDNETISKSQNIFKMSDFSLDQHESILDNKKKLCPVCTQTVDVKKFITHVKSCGTTYNISSEILIKAVDLQERQDAERDALGLPKASKSLNKKKKSNSNKQTKLKVGNDSNLDLAIAMSVSLQESKEAEIIKESETLLEAGLEKEAIEKRKTLENFGFLSNQPVKSKAKNFSKTNSLLFNQTKEDRENRITEKVAMILIDSGTGESSELLSSCSSTKIKSKYLNKIRNVTNKLWRKSLLEEDINKFYVENLSKFIKPCQNDCNNDLKRICLSSAQQYSSTNKSFTSNEVCDNTFHKIKDTSNYKTQNKTISEYSSKWKSMLGNPFMSDITIYSKDELEISVHSLVLFVQCPGILDDVIMEELSSSKTKKMIMWLEYSYEACFSFLELIYSGQESFIDPDFRDEYLNLCTRYNTLMAINDNDKPGWIFNDTSLKRKSPDVSNISDDCKRYKASSPDMFLPDESITTNNNFNFLEINVNDEKSLSVMKTKQWLEECNKSQQNHNLSFTNNLLTDDPTQTVLTEKSPSHSIHSASTLCLQLSPTSNCNYYNINLDNHDGVISTSIDNNSSSQKLFSTDKLSTKSTLLEQKNTKFIDVPKTNLVKNSTLTNILKEPELIIIDSDSESMDMIVSKNIKECRTSINNISNKNDNSYLYHSRIKNKQNHILLNTSNTKCKNYLNIIEMNDNSSDSGHSFCSKIIHTQKEKPHYLSSSPKNKTILIIDDDDDNFSSVPCPTALVSKSDTKTVTNCDSNSANFSNDLNLLRDENNSKSIQPSNVTNEKVDYVKGNNDKSISHLETSLLSPTFDRLLAKKAMEFDFSSIDYKSISTLNKSVSNQVDPIKLFDSNASKKTSPIEDDYELDKTICDQIIDDPWIDDCQPVNFSPKHVSPALSESNSVVFEDTPVAQTPNKNHICPINIGTQTPTDILNTSSTMNTQKKNAVTPNKYGSRINTPRSLRRVQSESVIRSIEQVTPLPDYSAMKTPDLRKEFDRYGLKDLGRRKGKLILRHIYDVLHPMFTSEEALSSTEVEQYSSDSSDNSEHGIPDYEGGCYEELETLSQTNLSNKTSVDIGFKQLLKVNEDLHNKILCYEPIWIEELKEYLKLYKVNISMQKLMTFLDDKCVTFRSKTLNDQRQKTLAKKNTKRKKLF